MPTIELPDKVTPEFVLAIDAGITHVVSSEGKRLSQTTTCINPEAIRTALLVSFSKDKSDA